MREQQSDLPGNGGLREDSIWHSSKGCHLPHTSGIKKLISTIDDSVRFNTERFISMMSIWCQAGKIRASMFAYCLVCILPYAAYCVDPKPPVDKSADHPQALIEGDQDANQPREGSRDVVRMSAKQILDKVASAYAKCKSYIDSGKSITESTMKNGSKDTFRIAFHTALRRGTFTIKYRFAYRVNYFGTGYNKATVLWHDGQRTMISERGSVEFEKEESLGRATAGLTGLSSGTAHDIPALLMPKLIGGRKLTEVTTLKPPKQEKLGKHVCYCLEGLYGDSKIVLWIEKNSFLILKIVQYYTVNEKPYVQIISYVPKMNEEIPNRLFEKQVEGEWENLKPIVRNETPIPTNPK